MCNEHIWIVVPFVYLNHFQCILLVYYHLQEMWRCKQYQELGKTIFCKYYSFWMITLLDHQFVWRSSNVWSFDLVYTVQGVCFNIWSFFILNHIGESARNTFHFGLKLDKKLFGFCLIQKLNFFHNSISILSKNFFLKLFFFFLVVNCWPTKMLSFPKFIRHLLHFLSKCENISNKKRRKIKLFVKSIRLIRDRFLFVASLKCISEEKENLSNGLICCVNNWILSIMKWIARNIENRY